MQIVSGRLDKDIFAQKKMVRTTWRLQDAGGGRESKHFSTFLKNLPENETFEEEDIKKNVADSVIGVFRGCHQDGLKVTMFLRGILL